MNSFKLALGLLAAISFAYTGCGKTEQANDAKSSKEVSGDAHSDADAGHDHPTVGPHKGSLIELGEEAYHAELLHPGHGATGEVTVYILDGSASKQVPIDAKSVAINIQHDGKPEQFTLDAAPEESDGEGKSSRFTSKDAELLEHFEEDHVHGKLSVKIEGKSFSGDLAHEH
jgi:hypothetical protein